MDYRLEAIIVPVADVDRAKAFYEQLGFTLDVDHRPNDDFRVVQVTPPGSRASIIFGKGMEQSEPGSYRGMHLVVSDIEAAHADLRGRGIDVGEPFHFGDEGRASGIHPDRVDYGTYFAFSDPDGNGWLVQEVGHRA